MSIQHLSWWHLSISAISGQILPKLFGPNFLGAKNVLDQHFVKPKLFGSKIIWTQNYLGPKILLGFNILWTKNYFGSKILFWHKFFFNQNFRDQNYFGPKYVWTHNFLDKKFFVPKYFLTYLADFSWFNLNITMQFSWGLTNLKLI